MIPFNQGNTPGSTQGNTQVYSPFGTIVVEQRDRGFHYPRLSCVPEPAAGPAPHGQARERPAKETA